MKPKTTFVKLRDLSGIGTQDGEDEDEKDEYITNDDTSIGTPTHGKVSFGKFKTKVEEEGEEEEKETTTEEGEKATSKWALLKDRGVLVSCLMYGVLGMIFVFYDEVNPYWSFLKVEDGGLGFTSTGINCFFLFWFPFFSFLFLSFLLLFLFHSSIPFFIIAFRQWNRDECWIKYWNGISNVYLSKNCQ